jgi:Rod binding domain-containing protein
VTTPIPPLSLGTDPTRGVTRVDPRVATSAQQLEGLFVRQLFAAMRETIPEDGAMSGGPGEAMFTAMMHEHLADLAPARWTHGIGAEITAKFRSSSAPGGA